MTPHSSHKQFLLIYLATSLFVCSAVATVNTIVDPYSLIGWIDKVGFNHEKPFFGRNTRLSKVFEVSRIRPNVIFLGTSRTDHGLDPLHPALAGKRTYNLGIDAAHISEIRALFEHAIAIADVKVAIIGLDIGSFNKQEQNPEFRPELLDTGDIKISNARRLEAARTSLSLETLLASYQTICSQDIPPEFTHQGHRTTELYLNRIKDFGGVRETFEGYLKKGAHDRPKRTHEDIMTSISELKAMLNRARQQGIEMRLFISPIHAWGQEYLRAWGGWNIFEDWKTELVKAVEDANQEMQGAAQSKVTLWDFSGYNSVTTENVPARRMRNAKMRYFWEHTHYKTVLGGWILERALNAERTESHIPQDFGVQLSRENIEAHLAHINDAREAYLKDHPEDVEFIKLILQQAENTQGRTQGLR